MKFLILGCNGMAGHLISLYLKEQGHEVTGYARKKSKFVHTIVGDAFDTGLLEKVIVAGEYDSIINCIGILNQYAEEDKASAVFLNAFLPHFLAKITKNMSTQVIHMSTDCVFSGASGGYDENAVTDGQTFYDRSKALGELINEKDVTLRNSIIGPDINKQGIGLMNWFLQQQNCVKGFDKAIWTGQTTLQLAKTMEYVSTNRVCGLYNAVPDSSISKYELLQLMNKYIKPQPISIEPDSSVVIDKSLIRTRYSGFDYVIPDYETMMKELGQWMSSHKEMYPHYYGWEE